MRYLVIALAFVAIATPAVSQTMVGGTISMIRTGWNVDAFAVVTVEPIRNPANCPEPDGYMSEKSFPGYNTYYAAALTAYVVKQPIVVTIHNTECCSLT
jgi:hypothetical protein